MGVGIVISKSEYEKIIPETYKNEFQGAVYFCLGHCLRLLIEHFDTVPGQPPKPLSFIHDRKTGKEKWIGDWYSEVRERFQHTGILGDLSFGPRNQEPGLQAADLLVGELRRYREGHPSKIIEIFREQEKVMIGKTGEKELLALVKKTAESMQ